MGRKRSSRRRRRGLAGRGKERGRGRGVKSEEGRGVDEGGVVGRRRGCEKKEVE